MKTTNTTNTTETNGLTIPMDVLEIVGMSDSITLTGYQDMIILKNTKMTALQVINAIEGLEDILSELYNALNENCSKCNDCESCGYCDGICEDNIEMPDWAMEEAGLEVGTKLCICVEEDSGIITLEPIGYDFDITDVSEEMLGILTDMEICIGELNESIIMEEIIYEG